MAKRKAAAKKVSTKTGKHVKHKKTKAVKAAPPTEAPKLKYPKALYHKNDPTKAVIVDGPAKEDELKTGKNHGWADSPADHGVETAPAAETTVVPPKVEA